MRVPQATEINPLSESQSIFLDLVRLLAAQVVLIAHIGQWLWHPFIEKQDFITKHLMGWYAVTIFYVLSGYLISKSIFKSKFTTGFTLGEYIKNRVARLWPTLLVAVSITLLVYFIISYFNLFGYNNYFLPELIHKFPSQSAQIKSSSTITTGLFLNDIVGVNGIKMGTMSMNRPLWTLSQEFWFYICAGLLAHGAFNKKSWSIILAISFVLWQMVFSNFIWIIGLLIWSSGAISMQVKGRHKQIIMGYLSILILLFILKKDYGPNLTLWDRFICGISAFLLVNWGLEFFGKLNLKSTIIKKGASYSFTLYAIHWPLIVLFVGAFGPKFNSWSLLVKIISCLLLVIGINVLAYLISKWSEDSNRWRKLISKLIPTHKRDPQ